jgi:putative FmdB family regulatory protein
MPRYDFRCRPCGLTFEVSRGTADRSPVPCPECGQDAKRVFSPVGVVFKGSGFHNTDYRTRPEENKGASSSAGGDGDAGPGSGKTGKADKSDESGKPGKAVETGSRPSTKDSQTDA